jgi:GNAT superfamily N-acetyltransferase
VCDVFEPWEYGTVVRASRYPAWWQVNAVRVERTLELSLEELLAFTDQALARHPHRRIWFERLEDAVPLRPELEARGWRTERLLMMLYGGAVRDGRSRRSEPTEGPAASVERVSYDAVRELRLSWHDEDFPDIDPTQHHADQRELALGAGAEVLAVFNDGAPVAYAQLEWQGHDAEIAEVYVHPSRRGHGLGTAVTRAAIGAASRAGDLWIEADDEYHARDLYSKLGFQRAYTYMAFLRVPGT